MKTFHCFLAAAVIAAIPNAPAQSQPTPSEVVPQVFPIPPPVSETNPVRVQLFAKMTSSGNERQASGEVIFTPLGQEVKILGRVDGLEANKRYQWILLPAGVPPNPENSAAAGKPGGNTPASGVTGSEPTPPGHNLGMGSSDAQGVATLDTTLLKNVLAKFPAGLVDGSVVIKRAPPFESPIERPVVATGRIVFPSSP